MLGKVLYHLSQVPVPFVFILFLSFYAQAGHEVLVFLLPIAGITAVNHNTSSDSFLTLLTSLRQTLCHG
jgi:hypothetical protein